MSFGEIQLKKFGWKEGKGLGRQENGISEPIKPKLKRNLSGLGHNLAEEFSFHWWDHLYNKATNNLSVDKFEGGNIQISKKSELKISTKRKQTESSSKSYGYFIKGCVLDGENVTEERSELKEKCLEKNDETQELIKKFSDEELFKLCKGRTAHKGARHGLKMSAKLARLEEQERAFLQGKTLITPNTVVPKLEELNSETTEKDSSSRKHKKKKKSKRERDPSVDPIHESHIELASEGEIPCKKKDKSKTEKYSKINLCNDDQLETLSETGSNLKDDLESVRKSKKRKLKCSDDSGFGISRNDSDESELKNNVSNSKERNKVEHVKASKKKKKKKSKHE